MRTAEAEYASRNACMYRLQAFVIVTWSKMYRGVPYACARSERALSGYMKNTIWRDRGGVWEKEGNDIWIMHAMQKPFFCSNMVHYMLLKSFICVC